MFNYLGILHNTYVLNDDQPHNTMWMFKYNGLNNFYEYDNILHFSEKVQPWGYWLLFSILSRFFDPLIATKVLVLPLLILTCVFLFLFLNKHFNSTISFIGVLLLFPITKITGLHARAFAYLFLFAFLYYYTLGKYNRVYVILLISVLFYPLICLLINSVFFLSEAYRSIKFKKINYLLGLKYFFTLSLILLIALSKSNTLKNDPLIGKLYNRKEILIKPEFSEHGRYSIQNEIKKPYKEILNHFVYTLKKIVPFNYKQIKKRKYLYTLIKSFYKSKWGIIFVSLTIIGIAYFTLKFQPKPLNDIALLTILLLISGITFYGISCIFPNIFYIPDKFLKNSIKIAVILIFLILISRLKNKLINPILLYAIFVFFTKNYKAKGYTDYMDNKLLYDFFKESTPSCLIAGPMYICDQIPIISRRSVVFSYETSNVFFKKYWQKQKQDIFYYYQILFTKSEKDLIEYINHQAVDYMIIDFSYYNKTKEVREFEPFKSSIKIKQNGNLNSLLFPKMKVENKLIKLSKDYYVLNCNDYINCMEPQ